MNDIVLLGNGELSSRNVQCKFLCLVQGVPKVFCLVIVRTNSRRTRGRPVYIPPGAAFASPEESKLPQLHELFRVRLQVSISNFRRAHWGVQQRTLWSRTGNKAAKSLITGVKSELAVNTSSLLAFFIVLPKLSLKSHPEFFISVSFVTVESCPGQYRRPGVTSPSRCT